MCELKKTGKVFTSKSVGTGPSSYGKRIYRAAVSQRLTNTDPDDVSQTPSVCTPQTLYYPPHNDVLPALVFERREFLKLFPGQKFETIFKT